MATYYVRTDGSDSNTGLGPSIAQAWQTVTKAIGATGVGVGDTVYFAPGTYRGSYTAAFSNPANSGQQITFIGDPQAIQFSGVSAGPVIWTNYTTNSVTPSGSTMLTMIKDYVTLQNICLQGIGLDGSPYFGRMMWFEGQGHVLTNCNVMQIPKASAYGPLFYVTAGGQGPVFTNCQFWNAITVLGKPTATAWNSNTSIKDCLFLKLNVNNEPNGLTIQSETSGSMGGVTIANCTVLSSGTGIVFTTCSTSFASSISNCFIYGGSTGISASANNGQVVQTYNSIIAPTTLTNVASSVTTATNPMSIIDSGYTRISGLNPLSTLAILTNTYGINAGINTYSPATDMYGVTWSTPSTPTLGAIESVTYSTAGVYLPTDRNASTITIAPGSTSQSIELYLGATGLTFATSGLAAYYVRNQSAPVAITLVTQTPTGAWSSGGFAEISSSLVPGVYRLDVPNAAFAAGASDVTIVVRGASGTNGAVLTVNLVEAPTDAVLVRMGPFEVKADGLGASDPLDIQKGAQHGIDIQCVDNNGAGIDITSATVTAKVYNSGATLVDTYSCTATYAADGRATFTIDTTVTNTPGTYTATITRSTTANDTQVFGPLRIYVRDI